MFASSTHKKMKLKNFELAAVLDRPQQVVTTFFGNNTNYYDNLPKTDVCCCRASTREPSVKTSLEECAATVCRSSTTNAHPKSTSYLL